MLVRLGGRSKIINQAYIHHSGNVIQQLMDFRPRQRGNIYTAGLPAAYFFNAFHYLPINLPSLPMA